MATLGLHNSLHNTRPKKWIIPTAGPTPSIERQIGLVNPYGTPYHGASASHPPPPPIHTHPARCHRSVIVTGAGPPICLPATRTIKGIKNALHHHTPHPLPPPHLPRLYHQGRPLSEDEPLHTLTTQHGFTHLTVRSKGEGLKGGSCRTRARDADYDSTSASNSSHTHRDRGREKRAKGQLTQALRAMTSLADSVAGICRTLTHGTNPNLNLRRRKTRLHISKARTSPECSPGPTTTAAAKRY